MSTSEITSAYGTFVDSGNSLIQAGTGYQRIQDEDGASDVSKFVKLWERVVLLWGQIQEERQEERAERESLRQWEAAAREWEAAAREWEKEARQGDAEAQFRLGFYWFKSSGLGRRQEAMEWLKKAIEQGHIGAQGLLGYMYAVNTIVVDKDSGEIIIPRLLNWRFHIGKVIKDSNGDQEAVKRWTLAADQGDARSLFNLGVMYATGRVVVGDNPQSVNKDTVRQFYLDALKSDDAEIQFRVGLLYEKGNVFEQNYSEAKRLYELAAAQKYPDAQYALGRMYRDGLGVPVDLARTIEYFTLASNQKYADALYALGKIYEEMADFKDYKKAIELYKKADKKGYIKAAFALGIMYKEGRGIAKDEEKALRWLRKAAEQGYEEAKEVLKSMRRGCCFIC